MQAGTVEAYLATGEIQCLACQTESAAIHPKAARHDWLAGGTANAQIAAHVGIHAMPAPKDRAVGAHCQIQVDAAGLCWRRRRWLTTMAYIQHCDSGRKGLRHVYRGLC